MEAQGPGRPVHRRRSKVSRRWMTALEVAVPVASLAVGGLAVVDHNRRAAMAAEHRLQTQWQRDLRDGLQPQAAKGLQAHLQELQARYSLIPGRWLAPWNGYDLALQSLSTQTTADLQSATDAARTQATSALRHWVKVQEDWGLSPDVQGGEKNIAAVGTLVELEALARQWTLAADGFERQIATLKREGGGFSNGRPADIVAAKARLQDKLAHPGSASDTVVANAQHVLAETSQYLAAPPAEEVSDHTDIRKDLAEAVAQFPVPVPPANSPSTLAQEISSYLSGRQSQVSVAVFNANTGRTFIYHPGQTFCTASIVKVTIMADLLHRSQVTGQPLSAQDRQEMVPMIEYSDNHAASDLWQVVGEAQGIEGFLQAAGMNQTQPGQGGYWGLTQTTALDQVQLMKLYAYPNAILDTQSRAYGLNLMEHITSSEDWGVSAGPQRGATVALKNGWLPASTVGWWINSIGYVNGDGRNYVIAVLSQGSPSEQDGISTVQQVSEYVWQAMGSPS